MKTVRAGGLAGDPDRRVGLEATAMNVETFLRRMFRVGAIAIRLPGGQLLNLGDGSAPTVAVTLSGETTLARIMAAPSLGVGEAYMDGRLVMERGGIRDLLELATRNRVAARLFKRPGALSRAWTSLVRENNARHDARRNVKHHYDLSVELYRAFLDNDLQYSCAYFERDDMSLEEAQAAKKRHIAAKLALEPGQKVLDIGCGWGGLAMTLAEAADVSVRGVTLSDEQLSTARDRATARGLSDKVSFSLTDYRDIDGHFDRIVSVGMFEHVGRPNYQAFFDAIAERLTDDGVALVHSIGRASGPSTTDRFTAERAGLWVTDLEVLRLHYAKTLQSWYERFQANREEMAALYDERFCRMWEFYLAGAEMGFRYGDHMNFQIQLTKSVDALPLTRGYIDLAEQALETRERALARPLSVVRPRS
jgi:cyclopropane-fatty-acyl-phospholipid synthase